MRFLKGFTRLEDPGEATKTWDEYMQYLDSIRDKLPESTRQFLFSDWYYGNDSRNCHDAWVERFCLIERIYDSAADLLSLEFSQRAHRAIDAELRLLGSEHDGYIDFQYKNVRSYTITLPLEGVLRGRVVQGHHDWLVDEISLSDSGLVVHEIEFRSDAEWMIKCESIAYQWTPFDLSKHSKPDRRQDSG